MQNNRLLAKEQIKGITKKINELHDRIYEIANDTLKKENYKLIYKNQRGEKFPEIKEEIEWYSISTEWDCPKSPFGYCMYHIIHDPAKDFCEFCGHPKERK